MDQPKKTTQFADTIVEHDASYTFDEEDLGFMFYSNAEVNQILKECKQQNELPLFWRSLRIHRTELLWDEIDRELYYQRRKLSEEEAAERDLVEDLARVSRKISKPQSVIAAREAQKIAQEVREMTIPSLHKTMDSLRPSGGLQSIKRNSIVAGMA